MKKLDILVDKAYRGWSSEELMDAPVAALKGLSEADGAALWQALRVRTVADWAGHGSVQAAQQIAHAAQPSLGLAPRAVTSGTNSWLPLYSVDQLRAWKLPVGRDGSSERASAWRVEGPEATQGLVLDWSALCSRANDKDDDSISVVCCDVLRVDQLGLMAGLVVVFARRIEVSPGAALGLDRASSANELVLWTQEIVDPGGKPCALEIQTVLQGDQVLEETVKTDGSAGAQGWTSAGDGSVLTAAAALDPSFLIPGEALSDFLTTLFQVCILLIDDHMALARDQALWISAITKGVPSAQSTCLQAAALAVELTKRVSMPAGAQLVPDLDHEVYKQDIEAWMGLLKTRQQRWDALYSDQLADTRWLDQAKVALGDREDAAALDGALVAAAQQALDDANGAYAGSLALLSSSREELRAKKLAFDAGVEQWKDRETMNAAFALTVDSVKAIGEIAGLVVAIAGTGGAAAAPVVGGAAEAGAAEAGAAESTPSLVEQGKALKEKVGDKPGDAKDALFAVVEDVQKIIDISEKADALLDASVEVNNGVDVAADQVFSTTSLGGLDVVTGGSQVWDTLQIDMGVCFDAVPAYKDIDGGAELRAAFEKVIVAGHAHSEVRLALAAAYAHRAEVRLRQATARSQEQRAEARVAALEATVRWDAELAARIFQRVLNTRRSLWLLCEQYQRSWRYYTLSRSAPALPPLVGDSDSIEESVTALTSASFTFEALSPVPTAYTRTLDIPGAVFARAGDGSWRGSWRVGVDDPAFAQWGRLRIDAAKAEIALSGLPAQSLSVMITLSSSGEYADRAADGAILRFVGAPIDRVTQYEQDSNGARVFVTEGRPPARLIETYFKPTPFTLWSATVCVSRQDGGPVAACTLDKLTLTLDGEASQLARS
ncbi:MAG: hypothetical protein RIT28_3366 [Pseudomonadota bacterium]